MMIRRQECFVASLVKEVQHYGKTATWMDQRKFDLGYLISFTLSMLLWKA